MRQLLTILATIAFVATPAIADVSITDCGQSVPDHETGVLANDLACPGGPGTYGVSIGRKSNLDLAGYTISGGNAGVRCETGKCTVTSTQAGGTISNAETTGIAVIGEHGKLSIWSVVLTDNLYAIVANADYGKVSGNNVTITGSGIGIQASNIKLDGLVASDNYRVIQSDKVMLGDCDITATEDTAILGGKVKLHTNSSVSGSGSGIDLLVTKRPTLVESTCEVSRDLSNPTETWGVCTND